VRVVSYDTSGTQIRLEIGKAKALVGRIDQLSQSRFAGRVSFFLEMGVIPDRATPSYRQSALRE
jgi:hypothetical protein